MKKTLALSAICTLCLGTIVSCDNADNSLVVGYTNFPPMGYVDTSTGNLVGFDIEVAAEVASYLNMEIEYQKISWETKEAQLESNRIDCVWNGFSYTQERAESLTLSDSYMLNSIIIMSKVEDSFETVDSLAGLKVCVEVDSCADEYMLAGPSSTFGDYKEYEDYATCFTALQSGIADAIIIDTVCANYMLMQNSDIAANFYLSTTTVAQEKFCIAFKRGNTTLRDQVDDAVDALYTTGIITRISNKYFNVDLFTRE